MGRLRASGRLAVLGSDAVTDGDGYCSRTEAGAATHAAPALRRRPWHEIDRSSRLLLPRRNRELDGHAGVSPVERKLGLVESRLAV